ncbi:MAG: acyl carrier protein [Eubacterium sp.]|nr:acyl carrier protein [Eubacterium sp.]
MFEELKEIICNYVEVEPSNIHLDSRFMEDLGFTSFDFVSMMGELEEQYDIEIDSAQAGSIRTVQEAVNYLTTLVE